MDASARTLTGGNGDNRSFFSLFSLFAPVQSDGVCQDGGFELVVPEEEFARAGFEQEVTEATENSFWDS